MWGGERRGRENSGAATAATGCAEAVVETMEKEEISMILFVGVFIN